MAQTDIDYGLNIIEAFDLDDLGLSAADMQLVKDRLQLRLQKIPNMYLAPLLNSLAAPAPEPDVAVDAWTGWVTCIAEELPPQKGTDISCDCGADIGQKCVTASGSTTGYHSIRKRINGNRNYDIERNTWFGRAKAGEVDFCKCGVCYGLIKSYAEQYDISCEEMEHKVRTEWA
jgi:hypothetical protein